MRAVVTSPDVVAVLSDHADRIHDLVRRLGCDSDTAVEVVQSSGTDLVNACAQRPGEVGDLAGWWAASAISMAERVAPATSARPVSRPGSPSPAGPRPAPRRAPEPPPPTDPVSVALDGMTSRARCAVLLRDSYDLPWSAVALGLRTSEAGAATVVADARVQLLRAEGGSPATLVAPPGVSVADLTRLADDPTPAESSPDLARVRRAVAGDPAARVVLAEQQQARRDARALPVIALDARERSTVLTRWTTVAERLLPLAAPVAAAFPDQDRPVLAPWIATLALVGALVAGAGVGAATATRVPAAPALGAQVTTTPAVSGSLSPTVVPNIPGVSGSPTGTAAAPTASAVPTYTVVGQHTTPPAAPTTRSVSPSVSSSPSATVVADPTVSLSPASGPTGTTITVTGASFTPNASVSVEINTRAGASGGTTTVFADARGGVSATIKDSEAATTGIGAHTVTVRDSSGRTASATFTQTTF